MFQREMNLMESMVGNDVYLDLYCWIHPTNISTNQETVRQYINQSGHHSIFQYINHSEHCIFID